MEYTVSAISSVVIVIALDILLKTRVLSHAHFWMFLLAMYMFMTIVNGYLTWRPIVIYGSEHILEIRLLTIPIEDYLYGFGLMTASVVVWEYIRKRTPAKKLVL